MAEKPIKIKRDKTGRVIFTKQMKKEYTLLFPMMAPIHFAMLGKVFNHYGYHAELLTTTSPEIAQTGLKYIQNDMCYPAILSCGQLIHAVLSGNYDVHKVALLISQTGGGCRVIYGDMLMCVKNQVEPYEVHKGEAAALVKKWQDELCEQMLHANGYKNKIIKQNLDNIVKDFAKVELDNKPRVKVGIVGEIYVKYAALGNNNLEDFLRSQDCEVNLPGMMNFILFKIDNRIIDIDLYGGHKIKRLVCQILFDYATKIQNMFNAAIKENSHFAVPATYAHVKELDKGVNGYGNCLPNHISGKGMMRKVRELYPEANIVAVDYDAGAPKVNQENRIKLMLSIGKENLEKELAEKNK